MIAAIGEINGICRIIAALGLRSRQAAKRIKLSQTK